MTELDWEIINTLKRTRNVTKASEFLHISQPALTKRIQKIEHELGIKIAHRNTRGLEFTIQGDYLAAKAEQVLAIREEIRRNLLSMSSSTIGSLKIFADNSCCRFVLPDILNEFGRHAPGIKITVSSGLRARAIYSVDKGESHIGIVKCNIEHYNGFITTLYSEQGCIMHRDPITIDQLPDLPRIDFSMDPYNESLIDRWWISHFNTPPLIGMKVSHGDTSREMVRSGLGYGLFLTPAYTQGCDDLCIIPMTYGDGEPVIRDTVIFCKTETEKLPYAKAFLDFICNKTFVPRPLPGQQI
jgi:DNA-binding transcriptional LysR family regulator